MRIVYVAKHGSGDNDDEGAIAHALRELGHEVILLQEHEGRQASRYSNCDFLLCHKWADVKGLKRVSIPKVFWYFDLVSFPDVTIEPRNELRRTWMRGVLPHVDLGFCTDGDWVKADQTGKLVKLTQGADERFIGRVRPRLVKPSILFTGGRNGGVARKSHIYEMEARYRGQFKVIEGKNRIHQRELAEIIAKYAITFAPDGPITDNYWSNRVYLMLGFGAFLLHPYIEALTQHYEDRKEVVYYRSREECFDLVSYYLEHHGERNEIAQAGYERTKREHLYRHRCEELLRIVKERIFNARAD